MILLPETAVDARRNAQHALHTAKETLSQAKQGAGQLKDDLDALAIPDALLAQGVAIDALNRRLGGIIKAAEDRPGLIGQRKQIETDIDRLLHDLPQTTTQHDVSALLPDTVARKRIRGLAQQHPLLISALEMARKALRALEEDRLSGKTKLDTLPPPRDFTDFCLRVERIRSRGEMEAMLAAQQAKLQGSYEQIDRALKKQTFWTATRDELETLALPSEMTLTQFAEEYQEQRRSEELLAERISGTNDIRTKLTHDLEDLRHDGAIPTVDELQRIRQERDAGWTLVYRAWIEGDDVAVDAQHYDPDLPLHDAFFRRIESADKLADNMRQEADRVARQTQLLTEQRRCEEAITALASEQEELAAARQALDSAWAACWAPLGIAPRSPREMQAWLNGMRDILRMAEAAREVARSIEQASAEIEEYKGVLVSTAEKTGIAIGRQSETLVVLMARGQAAITANEKMAQERERVVNELDGLSRILRDAYQEVAAAEQNLMNWQKDWAGAIANLRLLDPTPPDDVIAMLDVLEEIRVKRHEIEDKDGRIAGIDRDAAEFAAAVTGLLERIAADLLGLPVVQAAGELHARLVKAQRDATKRESLLQQIEGKRKVVTDAEEVIRLRTEELAELCRQAGCATADDLPDAEEKSKQAKKWQSEITGLERQVIELGEGEALADIVAAAATMDGDALPGQSNEMERRLAELDARRTELEQAIGACREAMRVMNGGDAAAVAANELQQVVAEMRDHADQYLRLRLAAALIRQQVEAYRQRNQTPVLQSAGEIFATLTLGSFAGIETDYDEKDRPVLIGVRGDGERVYVEGISDGTCDQLYLAMRLAALARHLETSEALPFIVDDILIGFDDQRAIAALRVLADFSRKTQVILFTHHTRLPELAQQIDQVDGIFMHNLEDAVKVENISLLG